jgi:hypothetical protein
MCGGGGRDDIMNVTDDKFEVYHHGMCFRFIHFILISTVHALFLTCLPVSVSGT